MDVKTMYQVTAKRVLGCAVLCLLAGCQPSHNEAAPQPNKGLLNSNSKMKSEPDERRELFAQIVEDDLNESAVIEGKPYKWFLKEIAKSSHDAIRKSTKEQLTFEQLIRQPGLYRGRVVTQNRGVIVEVAQAPLPPEYGLPPGYTVLPATFVDVSHDVYSVRILCPPNSKIYEKLKKGVDEDAYPVMRLTGYFMKIYARRTAREGEPPWQRPLLICPEPEFSQAIEPRNLWQEFVDGKVADLLPSERIKAPGAEERMLVQVSVAKAGPNNAGTGEIRYVVDSQVVVGELSAAIAQTVEKFKKRLPKEDAENPAAVILLSPAAPKEAILKIVETLRAAGVKRLAIKREQ